MRADGRPGMRYARGDGSRVRALAARLVAEGRFAGVSWRVTHRSEAVDEGALGHADHALERPLGTDAIHRVYSMTKPIVSIVALQLVEEGRLALDTPIARRLPGFAAPRVLGADGRLADLLRPITVEDLLTHRAGLSYDFLPDCEIASRYREARLAEDGTRSLEALVAELAALPLAEQPGTRYRYSYAIDVLAHLLERVLDRPLREVLAERLLAPLGMEETDFGVAPGSRSRLVAMHGLKNLGEVPVEIAPETQTLHPMDVSESYPDDRPERFARGGHGLFSTLDDYARFARLLGDGRAASGETLLSAPMLDMLWRNRLARDQLPVTIGGVPMPGYGWGLVGRVMLDVGEAAQLTVDGEGGWAGAASTWFWVDRANGVEGVVLAQFLGSAVPLGPLMTAAAYAGFVRDA